MGTEIGGFDYLLGFLYLIVIYFFAYAYKSKKEELDDTYKYFMLALSTKIFGGLGFFFLTVYYWGGGDTYSYFNTAYDYTTFLLENPTEAFDTFFSSAKNMNWYNYQFAFNRHDFLRQKLLLQQ